MKVITIGRHPDNDVSVNDPCASRHHFQIIRHDDGHFTLADFGSTNGTFINGQKISGEVDLFMNDVVRIGNTTVPWRQYFEEPIISYEEPVVQPAVRYEEPIMLYEEPAKVDTKSSKRFLDENRSFWIYWLLSIITLGIYGIVVWTRMVNDVNTIASPYDKRHTVHYCLMFFLLSWVTLGIYALVWQHNFADRVGNELRRRGIGYDFGAGTFWGWGFFGRLLLGIGPLIYVYKLIQSLNNLCHDYNARG